MDENKEKFTAFCHVPPVNEALGADSICSYCKHSFLDLYKHIYFSLNDPIVSKMTV